MHFDPERQRLAREQETWERLMGEATTCEQAIRLLRTVSLRTTAEPEALQQTIRDLEALAGRLKREAGVLP